MNEERFWLLVSLKFSGEASPEELNELNLVLRDHPELNTRFAMLGRIWEEKHSMPALRKKEAFDKHMQRLSNHFSDPVLQYETAEEEPAEEKAPGRSRWLWLPAAAAAVLLTWFAFFKGAGPDIKKESTAQNTITTKRGSKSKVQLPDGTQVWLNADSRLVYNESFQGKNREVQLTGEAFFDVVRDENRPFIIHTNTIDVKVLGTAFNVRSYANERNTETSLIRGSVEITLLDNPDKKIILKPNEKLVVRNKDFTEGQDMASTQKKVTMALGKINFQSKDSSVVETLWVKNKLAFDEETLEEIALKIERWFDVKVTIADKALKDNRYTAFFEDENLPQVMEALKLTGGDFNYSINKKEVTILP